MDITNPITQDDRRALAALADRIEASRDAPISIDASAAQLLRNLLNGCGESSIPVAFQVRRLDAAALWEPCTQELYEATLQSGRYGGFENGPRSEVRALGVIVAQDLSLAEPGSRGS